MWNGSTWAVRFAEVNRTAADSPATPADTAPVSDPTPHIEVEEVEDFAATLASWESELQAVKEGEVVKGTILAIDDDNIQVDVGFKSEGLIQTWEFMDDDGTILCKVGDLVDVLVGRMLGHGAETCFALPQGGFAPLPIGGGREDLHHDAQQCDLGIGPRPCARNTFEGEEPAQALIGSQGNGEGGQRSAAAHIRLLSDRCRRE